MEKKKKLFTNKNADEAWVWAVEYKLEWRVFIFNIYNCSIFGQRLYTLEAGPNETKKSQDTRSFFFSFFLITEPLIYDEMGDISALVKGMPRSQSHTLDYGKKKKPITTCQKRELV